MPTEQDELNLHLEPTFVIDSDSKAVKEKAALLTKKYSSQKEKAKELFYFVRDGIRWNKIQPTSSQFN